MFARERLIVFLKNRSDYKEIAKQLIALIPDREFYYPEILSETYSSFQKDIQGLVEDGRQNHNELLYRYEVIYLNGEYEERLSELVETKRKLLMFGFLMQDREKQMEMILRIADEFRLHKRLLSFKENFRKYER